MKQELMVSIVCSTYNHEDYIREALESFISQKTNFKYEVLIHDDASTDNTAKIIREYEIKYPDIIKPIYQSINQYSKGVSISLTYQFPRAKGKYIAFCEGDDYWIDPLKLQKQVDVLENNPTVDMCACSALRVDAKTGKVISEMKPYNKITTAPLEDVIMGGGGFFATNTLMFRKRINDKIPDYRKFLSIDYSLQINGAINGGVIFLPDFMSVYRYMVPNSWTSNRVNNVKKQEESWNKVHKMLKMVDEETDHKYSQIIKLRINLDMFYFNYNNKYYKKAFSKLYKDSHKYLGSKRVFILLVKSFFPFLNNLKLRNRKLCRKK